MDIRGLEEVRQELAKTQNELFEAQRIHDYRVNYYRTIAFIAAAERDYLSDRLRKITDQHNAERAYNVIKCRQLRENREDYIALQKRYRRLEKSNWKLLRRHRKMKTKYMPPPDHYYGDNSDGEHTGM